MPDDAKVAAINEINMTEAEKNVQANLSDVLEGSAVDAGEIEASTEGIDTPSVDEGSEVETPPQVQQPFDPNAITQGIVNGLAPVLAGLKQQEDGGAEAQPEPKVDPIEFNLGEDVDPNDPAARLAAMLGPTMTSLAENLTKVVGRLDQQSNNIQRSEAARGQSNLEAGFDNWAGSAGLSQGYVDQGKNLFILAAEGLRNLPEDSPFKQNNWDVTTIANALQHMYGAAKSAVTVKDINANPDLVAALNASKSGSELNTKKLGAVLPGNGKAGGGLSVRDELVAGLNKLFSN
jgi:hypothetical protein